MLRNDDVENKATAPPPWTTKIGSSRATSWPQSPATMAGHPTRKLPLDPIRTEQTEPSVPYFVSAWYRQYCIVYSV